MAMKTLDEHIQVTPGTAGGRPRIAGRRIRVQDIAVWHDQLGMTVDEVVSEYDLTPADVYAALAYYFDHREEIDRSIKDDEAFVTEFRRRNPSLLREKLGGRKGRGKASQNLR